MNDVLSLNKDGLYNLLTNPVKENFTGFIKNNIGEQNEIDFKEKWVSKGHLAKTILAIANSNGGLIVFGIKELKDGSINPVGLDNLEDKAIICSQLDKYLPNALKYEIYDFVYETSDYDKLKGKKFQVLIVNDIPESLPYISESNDNEIDKNIIYVRRGTKNEKANNEELQKIISRRVETLYSNSSQLELQEHLNQLKVLYDNIKKTRIHYRTSYTSFTNIFTTASSNKYYPNEEYDQFIARMIKDKKFKIEKVLDLK